MLKKDISNLAGLMSSVLQIVLSMKFVALDPAQATTKLVLQEGLIGTLNREPFTLDTSEEWKLA
jgi:hypothetical protein